MGSSYTWCNFTRVTPFLSHRFMRDPTDKNKTPLSIITLKTYLINSLLIISRFIKYFLCLFFSLLIKSFFPFSLQFLLVLSIFLVFFPPPLNITFLILLWERYLKAYYCKSLWRFDMEALPANLIRRYGSKCNAHIKTLNSLMPLNKEKRFAVLYTTSSNV